MTIDITNPGVVEVADQGYPRAPDGGTPAPTNADVRVVDQAEPPAPLDTVFSTNPPPPLAPVLPANQGNPLGLPVNPTIPAENPVRAGVVNDACSLKLFLDGCTFAVLTAGNISVTIILDSGTRFTFTQTLGNLQALGGTNQATLLFSPTPGNFIVGAIMTVVALQGPGLQVPTTTGSVQRAALGSQEGEIVPISSIATSQTITARLSDTLTTDLMQDGTPPVDPKAYLVSQVGSVQIDAAEAIQESVIGFRDTSINADLHLNGCTFAALTAGSLVVKFYCSDGTVAQASLSLADLQALGAVSVATVLLFPPIFGRIIVGTQAIVTALQGPGLATPSYFTVQRTGDPGYETGELVEQTNLLISQTVNTGVLGAASNVVTVTDNETGGVPTYASVNLRLTFQMVQSFVARGIPLNGRPIAFEAIDSSRPIVIMADYYLVVTNFNNVSENLVGDGGLQLGTLISFDTARYAGEMIFQVEPTATQDVTIESAPVLGIPAEVMTLKIDLDNFYFANLWAGSLAVVFWVNHPDGSEYHYQTLSTVDLQALGNRSSAIVTLPCPLGSPPGGLRPIDIITQVQLFSTSPFLRPDLSVISVTGSIQRLGRPIGEIVPTVTLYTLTIIDYSNGRIPQPPPPKPSLGLPAVEVNVADQVTTIGNPINILP
jgi:hypothetical protein